LPCHRRSYEKKRPVSARGGKRVKPAWFEKSGKANSLESRECFINLSKMERQTLTKDNKMNDLISTAILIATLFGGTFAADKIYVSVRRAALEKSAKGLPELAPFTRQLTKRNGKY
jgi:hypothetical protein